MPSGLSYSTVSWNPNKDNHTHQALVTQDGRSRWMTYEEAKDLMDTASHQNQKRWPQAIRVWDREDLSTSAPLPTNQATHTYLICTRAIRTFFDLLFRNPRRCLTPILVYGDHVIMGPRIDEKTDACPNCFALALLANLVSLRERYKKGHELMLCASEYDGVSQAVDTLIFLRETEVSHHQPGGILVLDRKSGVLEHERQVLCLCQGCRSTYGRVRPSFDAPQDFLGRFTGVFQNISRVDVMSQSDVFVMAATSRQVPYRDLGGGCSLIQEDATKKALYESVERLMTNHVSRAIHQACWYDLEKAHRLDLDILHDAFAGPSSKDEHIFDPTQVIGWVKAKKSLTDTLCWLPVDLAFAQINASPRYARPSSTGVAAWDSPQGAQEGAMLELAERDIVTRSWYEQDLVNACAGELVPKWLRQWKAQGIDLLLYQCRAPFHVPVFIACLLDKSSNEGALGCGAGHSVVQAAESAVSNASTMFVHRTQMQTLLPLSQDALPHPRNTSSPLADHVDWHGLKSHYDPVLVYLSPARLETQGVWVVRAWSSKAVDFPSKKWHISSSAWTPSPAAMTRLKLQRGWF